MPNTTVGRSYSKSTSAFGTFRSGSSSSSSRGVSCRGNDYYYTSCHSKNPTTSNSCLTATAVIVGIIAIALLIHSATLQQETCQTFKSCLPSGDAPCKYIEACVPWNATTCQKTQVCYDALKGIECSLEEICPPTPRWAT